MACNVDSFGQPRLIGEESTVLKFDPFAKSQSNVVEVKGILFEFDFNFLDNKHLISPKIAALMENFCNFKMPEQKRMVAKNVAKNEPFNKQSEKTKSGGKIQKEVKSSAPKL